MVETIRRLVVLSCIHWSLDIPDSFTEFIHLRAIFDKPEVLGLESQVFLYGTCRTIGSKRPEITSFPKLLPNTQLTNLNHSVVCSVPRPGWPIEFQTKKLLRTCGCHRIAMLHGTFQDVLGGRKTLVAKNPKSTVNEGGSPKFQKFSSSGFTPFKRILKQTVTKPCLISSGPWRRSVFSVDCLGKVP